jgi:hypothetical protein
VEQRELTFVIPTYRLRDVGETVEQYDQHFWRNGDSVRTMVFDDSSPVNQEKYFPLLEETCTHNDVYYVGPSEKEKIPLLSQRAASRRPARRTRKRTRSFLSTMLPGESDLQDCPDLSIRHE